MRLLSFDNWQSLNETTAAFAFDPSASYPDPNFGLAQGSVDSAKVSPGGADGNWGGSMPRALAFAKIANDFMGKNVISSQKRTRVLTASGNTSDHFKGNDNTYAVDLSCSGAQGDALLAHLMSWFGSPEYTGGSWLNVVKDGYRYQVGWKVKNHFDHIHVGVKKTTGAKAAAVVNNVETAVRNAITVMPGTSFAEKLIANPEFLTWYKSYAPPSDPTPTTEFINRYISENPGKKEWFINRFKLNSEGDKLNTGTDLKLTPDPQDSEVASTFVAKNIKTTYTGEKAKNIDLLVDEIKNQGITNKNTILGILSTIGKESGFVPKNEIPYSNTSNSRIRTIFGSRVNNFTDDELNNLKKNDVKFWDRVYGSDDPSGKSQQYGNSEPGDGMKYLGRGFNGITFKANYKKYGDMIGMDLVSNPEVLNDPKVAAKAAVKFLLNVLTKTMKVDPNSFTSKEQAILAFVTANHGGHSSPSSTVVQRGVAAATDISKNLDFA